MEVTYVSACFDASGYAEAARNNIAALHRAGVKLGVMPVSFERAKSDLGKLGALVKKLVVKKQKGKIRILHLTPPNYPRTLRRDCYNIGYAAWETDTLPEGWAKTINSLQEIWVPSQYNIEVMRNSGVTIPITCIPHTFNPDEISAKSAVLDNTGPEDFVFYSVFQWLERKNPEGLIRAYLTEFTQEDNVVLAIKTFIRQPGDVTETKKIKEMIASIKQTLYLKKPPRMLLISHLLSREQINSLHAEGDCYVALPHCEGFGIPITEAMLAGNPVITTGYGGPVDFIQHAETGYLVDYQISPVSRMPWDLYTGKMCWADPNLMEARKYMREVYENRAQAREVGRKGQQWIKENLCWDKVGKTMKKRLEEIKLD